MPKSNNKFIWVVETFNTRKDGSVFNTTFNYYSSKENALNGAKWIIECTQNSDLTELYSAETESKYRNSANEETFTIRIKRNLIDADV